MITDDNVSEEAILKPEPFDNAYLVIEPNKMKYFPYVLVGLIRCVYEYDNKTDVSEGVGMIIGEDLVITSAHNLYYRTTLDTFIHPSYVDFTPVFNGGIQFFQSISCSDFIIPEKFKELKQLQTIISPYDSMTTNDNILVHDYGIVFLPINLGSEIVKLFSLENDKRFSIRDSNVKIFNFFEDHVSLLNNIECLQKKGFSYSKISMVSYTKYHPDHLKNPNFRYKYSFERLSCKFFRRFKSNEEKRQFTTFISVTPSIHNGECSTMISESSVIASSLYNRNSNISKNINISSEKQTETTSLNSMNYFVFCSDRNCMETYTGDKIFYSDNQMVMCEAMGKWLKLKEERKDERELNYLITTYSGQSGSPLFLRVKKKNQRLKNHEKEYEYIFLGLHSRCPKPVTSPEQSKDFSSLSIVSYNCPNIDDTSSIFPNEILRSSDTATIPCSEHQENFITKTGFSSYNIGLILSQKLLDNAKKMILEKRTEMKIRNPSNCHSNNNNNSNTIPLSTNNFLFYEDYCVVDFFSYRQFILQGIFHKASSLLNVFSIGEKIFNIQEIFLVIKVGDQAYKFEESAEKKILDLINEQNKRLTREEEEVFCNVNIQLKINFEIDADRYGALVAKKILGKLRENPKNNEERFKLKDKSSIMLKMINYILNEIKSFYTQSLFLYGLLFNSIKDRVFLELNLR